MGKMSYSEAGVDIEEADRLIDAIKPIAARTMRPEILAGIGGFGALCEIPLHRYREPVLVSGTDGVGTKLKLAIEHQRYEGIGIDLVAMCVNDIITCGAEPLFFLDYYATGRLDTSVATIILQSIGEGCLEAGCALVGGETAEMPGLYQDRDFDLAGFCVGIVDKSALIDGKKHAQAGDTLLALASSGVHSNGYALVRQIIERQNLSGDMLIDDERLIDRLLTPTRIYAKSLLHLSQQIDVHGMAHITGGGLAGNLVRILPDHLEAKIDTHSWEWPSVFQCLQAQGSVETGEMMCTFNCGIGMVVIVPSAVTDQALSLLKESGETAWILGKLTPSLGKASVCFDPPLRS